MQLLIRAVKHIDGGRIVLIDKREVLEMRAGVLVDERGVDDVIDDVDILVELVAGLLSLRYCPRP